MTGRAPPALRPPITYYGAKGRLAAWIVSHLPRHRVYVEPFAGSLAVLLAKARSDHEVVNDLDGAVVAFWRCLRDRPDDLERACALTPYARAEFDAAGVDEAGIDDLELARRFWVRVTQGYGRHPGLTGWSIDTSRNGSAASSAWSLVGRFAPVAARLRKVAVECGPAVDVIRRLADRPDAVVYADPPYPMSTRTDGGAGHSGYRHEMSDDDHRELIEALSEAAATVVLSGYRCELYDEALAAWWRVERRVTRPTSNWRGGTGDRATEVLWSNRPLRIQQTLLPAETGGWR